jgi:hypothetical protein
MLCPSCSHENPQDAGFCGQCGASLAKPVTCPYCGRESPRSQKFCNSCGQPLANPAKRAAAPDPRSYTPHHLAEKILTSRSALEGERKQVTVLFSDVKGSMDLAGQVDPEEWHKILDRFFQILSDGVHRFEGTVNQYTGDGIMALFGAPIAHEDHARRTCLAVLYLRDALRAYADQVRRTHAMSFAARMGLNSGEVVVGTIGDDGFEPRTWDTGMNASSGSHSTSFHRHPTGAAARSILISYAMPRSSRDVASALRSLLKHHIESPRVAPL